MGSGHRIAQIAVVVFVAALPLTLGVGEPAPPVRAARAVVVAPAPAVTVVPNVTRLPYVFAKGALADSGLAWKVRRGRGLAGETVVGQSPKPGTRVPADRAAVVSLTLERTRS